MEEDLELLRIKEILEAIQEVFVVTIDWNYINKNYGRFK